MKTAVIKKNGVPILSNVQIADNFFTRFMGLMFKKSISDDYGLLIKPCNQIHMFNMRFPLDIVYLSSENKIVHIDKNVKINTVCKTVKSARSVVEINSGLADTLGLNLCDDIVFEVQK